MDHLHETGASIHHRRRRRRTAITLTLVALVMIATFAYAAAYYQGWVGSTAPQPVASPACQTVTPVKAVTPRTMTVNVYNSTDRAGLAAFVAKALRTQGFNVGDVANDPLGRPVSGVGEIRYGRAGAAAATLAATRLRGARLVLDSRTDPTVDLVLGIKFKALSVPPKAVPPKVPPTKVPPTKVPPTAAIRPTPSSSPSC